MLHHPQDSAFNTAKEITVACLSGSNVPLTKEAFESVADFFETVYNRALKIASSDSVTD